MGRKCQSVNPSITLTGANLRRRRTSWLYDPGGRGTCSAALRPECAPM